MTITSALSFDTVAQTASNTFSINGWTANNLSLGSNQITWGSRVAQTLSPTDFDTLLSNLENFRDFLTPNFPILSPLSLASLGNMSSSLTRVNNTNVQHTLQGSTNASIHDFTYDYSTKLINVAKRNQNVTTSFSLLLFAIVTARRFQKEFNN